MQPTQLQEKELAGTLLYLQKIEASALCTTTLESSNDQIRSHASTLLNRTLQNQKSLFDIMNKKGWYKIETAPTEQYNTIQQSISTVQSQIQSY